MTPRAVSNTTCLIALERLQLLPILPALVGTLFVPASVYDEFGTSLPWLTARRVARQLGLPLVGTIGLLLQAKTAGLVPLLGPLLEQLRGAGFRLTESLANEVLRKAGELK